MEKDASPPKEKEDGQVSESEIWNVDFAYSPAEFDTIMIDAENKKRVAEEAAIKGSASAKKQTWSPCDDKVGLVEVNDPAHMIRDTVKE